MKQKAKNTESIEYLTEVPELEKGLSFSISGTCANTPAMEKVKNDLSPLIPLVFGKGKKAYMNIANILLAMRKANITTASELIEAIEKFRS